MLNEKITVGSGKQKRLYLTNTSGEMSCYLMFKYVVQIFTTTP